LHIFEPCKKSHDNFIAARTVAGYYNIKNFYRLWAEYDIFVELSMKWELFPALKGNE